MKLELCFVHVGPQRTGTTWLYNVLHRQRSVCLPKGVKETMFFDLHYQKGLSWYEKYFKEARYGQRIGEISPTYFDSPEACTRIKSHFTDCKIIVQVRNPVERAISLFRHHVSKGRVSSNLERALEEMPRILSSGYYSRFCAMWENAFGSDRVCYLVQEDIKADARGVLQQVEAFLGIEKLTWDVSFAERINASTIPRWRTLASVGGTAGIWLHSHRLHWIVNLGKRLGLRKVFFTGGRDKVLIDERSTCLLWEKLRPEIEYLESKLGRQFPLWHTSE